MLLQKHCAAPGCVEVFDVRTCYQHQQKYELWPVGAGLVDMPKKCNFVQSKCVGACGLKLRFYREKTIPAPASYCNFAIAACRIKLPLLTATGNQNGFYRLS